MNARDIAAQLAGLPIEERAEEAQRIAERALGAVDEEAHRASSRAPRRLRLNITRGTASSPGYVECSVFQSNNGVNWGCVAMGAHFPEVWFREVFGSPLERGRRIEFEIVNAHDVRD